MASYSVAEAKDRLPALLVAAERGEAVTITRRGTPVVTLTPVNQPHKVVDPEAMQRVIERRRAMPRSDIDAGTLLRAMRDERDL